MMTPERFRQVEALYHTALEKPPEERAAFLAQACDGDQALRRKVASLLKAHERAGELFASPLRPLPSLQDAPVPTSGAQLGPYEIIDSLGKGGMGEVYRAKDTRLGRQVAIKVLPTQFSADRERLRYFEQEARAASALNHPSIVTIYDIGQSPFGSYIAMELVDGPTVRALLANGPLTPKKTLNLATQVADGLAKAHAAGIVHRDLKPENLMITRDGLAKILDFGVAKLVQPPSGSEELKTSAATGTIELISILGTPGYMSPEQASGHSVDFRSDQFSLGAILYETATGKRAFHGASELDTISAIIREDPENIARLNPKTFPAFRWVVERCLSKAPEDRYASTFDLARELQNLRDHLPELATAEPASSPAILRRKARSLRTFARLALTIVLVASLIGVVILGTRATGPVRHFKQLTFVNGNITGARFAADGQSVIYGMNSGANPPELFTAGLGNPESRSLHLPNSSIWSVSPSGEMAIAVGCLLNWSECIGTLARAPAPPSGGEPREIQPDVHSADWDLDGNELAIAQFSRGKDQLQYRGRVLYETSTSGWIGDVRFSRRGDWIAFVDHDVLGSKGGSLRVVDLEKHTKILSTGWTSLQGLAWSTNGDEVWFSGSKGRPGPDRISAVSLAGKEREILSYPTNVQLMDISRDGRVLLRLGTARAVMMGLTQADGKVHNLSWLDFSTVADLSPDGLTTLFYEWGAAMEGKPKVYLRRTDGSDAARQLADGKPLALSPDGNWVLALRQTPTRQLVLLPTGSGDEKPLPSGEIHDFLAWAEFSRDSERVFFAAEELGHRRRTYVQSIQGGPPEPVTPDGYVGTSVSPDGRRLIVAGPFGGLYHYRLDGELEPLGGYEDGDTVLRWSGDGRSLFLRAEGDMKLEIFKLDLASRSRTPWKELGPSFPAGLIGIATDPGQIRLTPDGRSYVYTYWTFPGELYQVAGLK